MTDAPPPQEDTPRRGADWLTVALVLVIVVNVGLYLYNTKSRPGAPPPPPHAGGGAPGAPGGGAPAPPPPPPPPGSPAPGGGGSPPAPHIPEAPSELSLLVTSPQGMAALIDLGEQAPPTGLTAEQKKRLVAALEARLQSREHGTSVASMMALLKPAQLDFLRGKKAELGAVAVSGADPVSAAAQALEKKAGGADPATPGPVPPAPEFDPLTFAQGLLLLDGQTGDLALQPAQAAALLPLLKATSSSGPVEDPLTILTDPQKEWVQKNAPKADVQKYLGAPSGGDLSVALQRRLAQEFAK